VRASLFITCLADTMFPDTGRATVTVLERLGVEIAFPAEQTCCGQMHINTGYGRQAIPLVRRFVRTFADAEVVVAPSASCVATVRHEYPRVAALAGDPALEREVRALAPRVLELTELLIDRLGVEDVGAVFPHTVTYHPTCHSLRALRVGDRPLRLLRAVRDLELRELPGAEECCGFGGTFAVKNADTSLAIVADKVRSILDSGAEYCVSADSSCLMHIGGALSRGGGRPRPRPPPPPPVAPRRTARPRRTRRLMSDVTPTERPFPDAAREALADGQLRANLRHVTHSIRAKRAAAVAELPDWEALREAGAEIKRRTMAELDSYLLELEAAVSAAGGTVHWARDGEEAGRIVGDTIAAHAVEEVVKAKSLTTEEIDLNAVLGARGIRAWETDLAQLIIQLSGDTPSHILVPAIHRNRSQIRDLFVRTLPGVSADLSDDPRALAEVARAHLRELFLRARVGISGANFAVAQTGTVAVVESEGNARMCTTLPEVLITVMGIEKVIPTWQDLEVYLQLLPRSATAERMNPYTSLWTGVTDGDGPREFHLVLVDNGRSTVLADEVGREALHCIRCSACLNVCPVYERTGGHAYGATYPGPIGAILTPLLTDLRQGSSLPFASSLCGACYEVCPVKIDIPRVLVHLRGRVVEREDSGHGGERAAMSALARVFAHRRVYELAQRLGELTTRGLRRRRRLITRLPGSLGGWTRGRDLPAPEPSFRDWWRSRR
jgi:L-lactate dehydrogenase complex protein LldF